MVHAKKSADVRKNWWMLAIALAAALALAGCEDKITQVEGTVTADPSKASAPSSVAATKSGTDGVSLDWKAASGAVSYNIYLQKDGTTAIKDITSFFTASGAPSSDAAAPDDYTASVSSLTLSGSSLIETGKGYKFGVQAKAFDNKVSDNAWSATVTY